MQRAAAQLDFDTNKLRTLIAEYVGIEAELVTDDAHFSDDLGLDWLDQLELMALIEDEFASVEFFANTTAQIELVRFAGKQYDRFDALATTQQKVA